MSSTATQKPENNTSSKQAYLLDSEIALEKKVNTLLFDLNSINASSHIVEIYNNLRLQKTEAINSYELLSNQLKEELAILVEHVFQLKLKVVNTQVKIDAISAEIKDYAASIDPNKTLDSCQQYKDFLKIYDSSLDFSKEIVAKKGRMEVILETQKLLDSSYASKIVEVDYQLIKLNDIINNFNSVRSESLLKAYSDEFNYTKQFKNLVLDKDYAFEKVRGELDVLSEGFCVNNPLCKKSGSSIDSVFNHLSQ